MEKDALKKLAVDSNKQTWDYLSKNNLNREEQLDALASAYTSLFFWLRCGTTLHQARGHWLICRVAVIAGEYTLALRHAELCQKFTGLSSDAKDFDVAYQWEALARAHALLNQTDLSGEYKLKAQSLGEQIADPEDQKIFITDFQAPPWSSK